MIRPISQSVSFFVVTLIIPLFGLGGCSSDSDPASGATAGSGGASGGNGGSGGGAAGATNSGAGGALGGFVLRLVPADVLGTPAYSSFSGSIYDGVLPEDGVWTLKSASGDCELLIPSTPFCDPACSSGTACVEDGVCLPMPSTVDVGSVELTGVGSAPITLMAGTNNSYQLGAEVTLPYPPAADGAAVSVSATGGSFGAFEIESEGIAPLELMIDDPLPVQANEAVRLTWTPGMSDLARVLVELDVSHHGGTKGKITCETGDTGSLEIAASLITDLLALGIAGFPTIDISRRAVGKARVARGDVELMVAQDVKRDVSIPGLISCGDSSECPMGQTCEDLRCQ